MSYFRVINFEGFACQDNGFVMSERGVYRPWIEVSAYIHESKELACRESDDQKTVQQNANGANLVGEKYELG